MVAAATYLASFQQRILPRCILHLKYKNFSSFLHQLTYPPAERISFMPIYIRGEHTESAKGVAFIGKPRAPGD